MSSAELILVNKRPVRFDEVFGNRFAKRALELSFLAEENALHSVDRRVRGCRSFLLFGVT